MSDFLDSIKVTDEEKKKSMSRIIFIMMNSANILSLNELLKQYNEIKEKLNENEILAIYSLAKQMKQSIISSSNRNKKLFEFLDLNSNSINEDKLLEFIKYAVKDIEVTSKRTPNVKWSLQIGKIFLRMEGKDPYEEEIAKKPEKKAEIVDIKKILKNVEKC
jgi:hypothetical protein